MTDPGEPIKRTQSEAEAALKAHAAEALKTEARRETRMAALGVVVVEAKKSEVRGWLSRAVTHLALPGLGGYFVARGLFGGGGGERR